jgi:hypothetical protein
MTIQQKKDLLKNIPIDTINEKIPIHDKKILSLIFDDDNWDSEHISANTFVQPNENIDSIQPDVELNNININSNLNSKYIIIFLLFSLFFLPSPSTAIEQFSYLKTNQSVSIGVKIIIFIFLFYCFTKF